MSLKMTRVFENPSVAVLLFCYKRSSGRHKRSFGRSVSEAAPHFGNLCVYKPSSLGKKPSASSEETLWFSEEAFRFAEEAFQFAVEMRRKHISERRSELRHQFKTHTVLLANTHMYSCILWWFFLQHREVPDYLCGKISFELMVDPYITPSGITYPPSLPNLEWLPLDCRVLEPEKLYCHRNCLDL